MKDMVLTHKKGFTLLACVMIIFAGCFTFPAINITRMNGVISFLNIFISVGLYFEIGVLLRYLCEKNKIRNVALLTAALTVVGFLCRFLLEYGEISNVYNFTVLNVIIHMVIAVVVTLLSAVHTD